MNLCILKPEDYNNADTVRLEGRRAKHIIKVIKAKLGDNLRVGNLNGNIGRATIITLSQESVELQLTSPLIDTPSAPLPLTLILALPRPQMLQRSLQTIATMGVERLVLIQSERVEKSFWQTPQLADNKIEENLTLGLEQGIATQMPELHFCKNFKRFAANELDTISDGKVKLIAHPGDYPCAPSCKGQASVLAIGPEGGFVEHEVDTFLNSGFKAFQLGQRILRVETAVPVCIAKLY